MGAKIRQKTEAAKRFSFARLANQRYGTALLFRINKSILQISIIKDNNMSVIMRRQMCQIII